MITATNETCIQTEPPTAEQLELQAWREMFAMWALSRVPGREFKVSSTWPQDVAMIAHVLKNR